MSRDDCLVELERRRLRASFRRATLLAIAAAACGTKAADSADAGAPDAAVDAGAPEAGADAGAADASEGGPKDPCESTPYTPNPPDTCGDFVRFPCGLPSNLQTRGACYFELNDCAAICPDIHYSCRAADGYCADGGTETGEIKGVVVPDDAGAVVVDCSVCPGNPGRAPAGLAPPAPLRARSLVGAWLAAAARLEAASIAAFVRLERELEAWGAPRALAREARRAARDEAQHARTMARLARRYGGACARPSIERVGPRSLEAIARENAVEGCVRETFAALVAAWQAERAADAELAGAFARIADDEARHAALSWAVARWAAPRLDDAARARIGAACADAIAALAEGASELDDPRCRAVLGLPSKAERARLARGLDDLFAELAA